jgi:hypothetical protein
MIAAVYRRLSHQAITATDGSISNRNGNTTCCAPLMSMSRADRSSVQCWKFSEGSTVLFEEFFGTN